MVIIIEYDKFSIDLWNLLLSDADKNEISIETRLEIAILTAKGVADIQDAKV